jgi:hypothetical protein
MKSVPFLATRSNCVLAIMSFFPLLAAFTPALFASERAIWLEKMQPISPEQYVCRKVLHPLAIDGKLDEPAWKDAQWTSDFVDIEGAAKPSPRFRTRAKMLWDDKFLYLAAELEEPHVWATLTNHDSVIFHDPDFEVFIDPVGRTQPYYEFEINALNTTWDLRLDKPYQDNGKAADAWEIIGAQSAVQIHGTLNQPTDTDTGWAVEMAFPWTAFAERTRLANAPKKPSNGESAFHESNGRSSSPMARTRKFRRRRRIIGSGLPRVSSTCTGPRCGALCNLPVARQANPFLSHRFLASPRVILRWNSIMRNETSTKRTNAGRRIYPS